MSRLQQMRLRASEMQMKEPADLLKAMMAAYGRGDKISAAAARAVVGEKNFERQAIIRRRIS